MEVDSASMDCEDLNNSSHSSNSLQSPPHKIPAAARASSSVEQDLVASPHPVIFHLSDGKGNFWQLCKTKSAREQMAADIKAAVNGRELKSKIMQGGDLMVYPVSKNQQKSLLKMKKCGGRDVICSLPYSAQFQHGIIKDVPTDLDEDDILGELKEQKVVEVRRFERTQGIHSIPTGTIKLTFKGSRPAKVNLGGQEIEVEIYIDKPFRCRKCWGLYHTQNKCFVQPRCVNCGSTEHQEPSNCVMKCVNCKDTRHNASNNSCPMYQEAEKVVKMASAEKIPFPEAQRRLRSNVLTSTGIEVHNAWSLPLPPYDDLRNDLASLREEIRLIREVQVPAALAVAQEAKEKAEEVDGKTDDLLLEMDEKYAAFEKTNDAFKLDIVDTLASFSAQNQFDLMSLLSERLPIPQAKPSGPTRQSPSTTPKQKSVEELKKIFMDKMGKNLLFNNGRPTGKSTADAAGVSGSSKEKT